MTKKFSFIVLGLLASALTHAAEKSTIEFKLMAEEYRNNKHLTFPFSDLNKDLKKLNLPGFPEVGVFGKNDAPYVKLLKKRVEISKAALKRDFDWLDDGGGGMYYHNLPTICYRGKATDVPAILTALEKAGLFAEYQQVAYKIGKKKFVNYPEEWIDGNSERQREYREELTDMNPDEVKMWDKYKTTSETVLWMTNLGPQGDGLELYATEIKRCR